MMINLYQQTGHFRGNVHPSKHMDYRRSPGGSSTIRSRSLFGRIGYPTIRYDEQKLVRGREWQDDILVWSRGYLPSSDYLATGTNSSSAS